MTKTNAGLIKRISVDSSENFGITKVDSIPGDVPALVAFGGDLTQSEKQANFYASMLLRTLVHNKITDVRVYSVFYDMHQPSAKLQRADIFRRAGRRMRNVLSQKDENRLVEMRAAEPSLEYVNKIFDAVLRPRIFDKDGAPRPAQDVIENIRKLKFFTHCHGSAVVYMLSQIMTDKMTAAGYKKTDIRNIQKQLLVIQYAPVAPLDKQQFTILSFGSTDDSMMLDHNNNFADYMIENSVDMFPAFFAAPRGNVFVAPELHLQPNTDHALSDLMALEVPDQSELAENGIIIYSAMRNALVRGARHSLTGGPLPDVRTLTDGNGVDFDSLNNVGDFMYKMMLQDVRANAKISKGKSL